MKKLSMLLFFNEEKHNPFHLLWVFIFIVILSPIRFETENFNNTILLNTLCVVSYAYLLVEGVVRIFVNRKKTPVVKKVTDDIAS